MNITELLIPQIDNTNAPVTASSTFPLETPIHDEDIMELWESALMKAGYLMKTSTERNTLTDVMLSPMQHSRFVTSEIPVHVKVIGRHMNGSFRCHMGTSKASRPIQSIELYHQMRLLAVFFRTENSKSQLVSPEFIFFPTWLLHLFRYTQHESTPGRTDVRFLENENMAKEDHIYRLNHVLNTLFRFNIHHFDPCKLKSAIELANFLFDTAGLEYRDLPRPIFPAELPGYHLQLEQPSMYSALLVLLHSPRPTKFKPMCFNCNTKPASRRRLCVACYRYQLKHGGPRPLRLIVANRPGPRYNNQQQETSTKNSSNLPVVFYSPKQPLPRTQKFCANCKVKETHQWYRNLCGHGNWCETCKSYYLRHTKVRPPELFVKAAKRKVDVRNLVNWNSWSWDEIPMELIEQATHALLTFPSSPVVEYSHSPTSASTSPSLSSTSSSYPNTPLISPQVDNNKHHHSSRKYSTSPKTLW